MTGLTQDNVDLMNSFAHALDAQDWTLLRSLLTDDFSFGVRSVKNHANPGPFVREVVGPDKMLAFVKGTFSLLSATHHLFANHVVDQERRADEARCSCYVRIHHAGKGDKAHLYQESLGRFDFVTVYDSNVWKIRRAEENVFIELGTTAIFS